ncbi:hypothetical protein WJX77_006947 [Trebouxia sp. C0004]
MDDFDASDLSALFAEVDEIEARGRAPQNRYTEPAQTLGNQARQYTQAPPVHRAVVDPKTSALVAKSALNSQAAALQSGLVQTTTPRSREEIRKLFTRRSSSLQPAASLQEPSTNLHGSSHPASRLQHHSGPTRLEPVLPETAPHFQPVLAPQTVNQLAHSHHHAVCGHHEATQQLTASALGNQAPATFGQYAYPGSSHQNQRASGQSFHQSQQPVPQRNSVPPQRTLGPSHGNHADASAVARPSMSSGPGPTMRAEVLMGPDATIEVNVRFHANIAAALKSLEGAEWISNKGLWRMPMSQYVPLMKALPAVPGVRLDVEPLPTVAQALVQAAVKLPDDSDRYSNMPAKLQEKLMGFQREGIKFALKRGGRLLVGDEMGLGKTVQAIGIMACYKDEWPCIIITPSSLREQWADALHQWLGITDDCVHMVTKGKDCQLEGKKFQFLITSYNFVPKLKDQLQELAPQVMVLDEAHSIKASKSVRTQETVPLLKAAKRVVLLTGTPALSRPKELFSQLTALAPSAKLKMKDFGERYCQCDRYRPYGGQYDGASNLAELNRVLNSTVMVRRLKSEVLDQLPPKRRQHVYLQLQEPQNALMKALKSNLEKARELKNAQANGGPQGGADKGQQQMIMELYQKCAQLKSKAVAEHVGVLLDADEKFLIFSHHSDMHNAVEAAVRGKKVKFIRIDGSTPAQSRGELVHKFQQNSDVRVAILSINAAGTGLTLTAASMVVFAEYSWTPGTLVQAEDRVHRIGQANSVNVYYLHAKGSIDDIIWQTLEHKLDDVGQVLNGKSDSFQMLKSQQQVSANQGRLDAFMSQSQPGTAAPAVPSTATAGPTATTPAPSAASHASTAVAAPTTAAATSGTTLGRPSWVKARPDQRSNRGIVAPDSAARPRDITNLPLIAGTSPSKGQAKHSTPNTVSPGKQTTMQSFFQPKQVLQPQQHSQQQQAASFGNLPKSAAASGNRFQPQGAMQNAAQQQDVSICLAGTQQGSWSWHQPPQHHQQWQQQMLAQAAPMLAVNVSGVFANDDDFDDIWMSDQAFQAPAPKPAHNLALPGAGQSIQAMPVIDLAGSPAHKKPRTLGD